jgi:hypothetical protein
MDALIGGEGKGDGEDDHGHAVKYRHLVAALHPISLAVQVPLVKWSTVDSLPLILGTGGSGLFVQ